MELTTLVHILNRLMEMSHYNKLSDFQYALFQILAVQLHCRLFWSRGIPIVRRRYDLTLNKQAAFYMK